MSDDNDEIPVCKLVKLVEGNPEYEASQAEWRRLEPVYPREPRRIAEEVHAIQRRLLDLINELHEALSSSTVDGAVFGQALRDAINMLDEARRALGLLGSTAVMTSKNEDELSTEDFVDGSIWVEYEDASELIPGFHPDRHLLSLEGYTVRVGPEYWPLDTQILRDLDRFLVGCEVRLVSGVEWPGIAFIRGTDLEPYLVKVFTDSGAVLLSLPSARIPVQAVPAILSEVFPLMLSYSIPGIGGQTTKMLS